MLQTLKEYLKDRNWINVELTMPNGFKRDGKVKSADETGIFFITSDDKWLVLPWTSICCLEIKK